MSSNLYRVDVTSLLDDETSAVLKRWEADIVSNSTPTVAHEALIDAFRERDLLSLMLKTTDYHLKHADESLFRYLLLYQKELLRRQLVRAHYLYALQASIDAKEFRWDGLKFDRIQCARYKKLLIKLRSSSEEIQNNALPLARLRDDYVEPFSLFGMVVLAPLLASSMFNLCAGKTAAIKNLLIDADRRNVYTGWSRALISSCLSLIPDTFISDENIENIRNITPTMSFMNILVVNTCLGIEWYLLMKNTFAGAWATRNQALRVDPWEQFTTQWQQRKFVLLNWLFLSVMHLSAFLCLMGVLNIWPWGPVFAVGCRMVQLAIISARYEQDLTAHRSNLLRIKNQIEELNNKNKNLNLELSSCEDQTLIEKIHMDMNIIQIEIDTLRQTLKRMDVDWQLKDLEIKRQACFTTYFFIGVMLFSCLIFPPAIIAPPIALALGLAGAAICFTSIVILSKVRSDIAIDRTRSHMLSTHLNPGEKQTLMDEELNSYINKYIQLKSQPESLERDMEMKQLYLNMSQLVIASKAQSQILERQKAELILKLAQDILMPVIIVLMAFFIPTGIGLGVVASLILLHIFIKKMISVYYPMQEKKLTFDEKRYQQFSDDPKINHLLYEKSTVHYDTKRFYPLMKQEDNDNLDNNNILNKKYF